jgi:hypothetical protein
MSLAIDDHREGPLDSIFQCIFEREGSLIPDDYSCPGGIRVDVPSKFTHCKVNISREWAAHTDLPWDREEISNHGCGRPRTNGNGFFRIAKHSSCLASVALSRGDPILRRHPGSQAGFHLFDQISQLGTKQDTHVR